MRLDRVRPPFGGQLSVRTLAKLKLSLRLSTSTPNFCLNKSHFGASLPGTAVPVRGALIRAQRRAFGELELLCYDCFGAALRFAFGAALALTSACTIEDCACSAQLRVLCEAEQLLRNCRNGARTGSVAAS